MERARSLDALTEMPSALLAFAAADLDVSANCVGNGEFHRRFFLRQCQYRVYHPERSVEFAVG